MNKNTKIGSIFVELYVQDVQKNISFFVNTCGFELSRNEGNFAELHFGNSRLLLNQDPGHIEGNYFAGKLDPRTNGHGVEIGVFVDNLNDMYDRVKASGNIKHISEIKNQEWGMTDFRITTTDNYYLRFTTREQGL